MDTVILQVFYNDVVLQYAPPRKAEVIDGALYFDPPRGPLERFAAWVIRRSELAARIRYETKWRRRTVELEPCLTADYEKVCAREL